MDTQNTSRQLRYLEEVRIPLHRAGFETLPVEGEQLPVLWNGTPLCRITGKGSVFYRREDADTPQACLLYTSPFSTSAAANRTSRSFSTITSPSSAA